MSEQKKTVLITGGAMGQGRAHAVKYAQNGFNVVLADMLDPEDERFQETIKELNEIIYVFLTIFLYLLKCPQSLILSALRAFCFCGKPHISRSIFLYFRYQAWLKSW